MEVYWPKISVVLQELPGHISLAWAIRGCPLGCKGCSYKSLEKYGWYDLRLEEYESILDAHRGLASSVTFMGGEWVADFPRYLQEARERDYKTCLYTGREIKEVSTDILASLDFIKTGSWQGIPITEAGSNQRFYSLPDGKDLTWKFRR